MEVSNQENEPDIVLATMSELVLFLLFFFLILLGSVVATLQLAPEYQMFDFPESRKFAFQTNSAEPDEEFKEFLFLTAPSLLLNYASTLKHPVIEIRGSADVRDLKPAKIGRNISFDKRLRTTLKETVSLAFASESQLSNLDVSVSKLAVSDNAGLALQRASTVAQIFIQHPDIAEKIKLGQLRIQVFFQWDTQRQSLCQHQKQFCRVSSPSKTS